MWFLWGILSAVTFGLSGFLMKVSSARRGSTLYTLLGLYLTGTLGFFGWALQTETLRADLPLLIAGIVIGLGSAAGNLLFMKALDQGPASLTSPLVNTNILLIILFSVIVYGERLSGTEIAGVILLILAVSLIPFDPDEELKIKNYPVVFPGPRGHPPVYPPQRRSQGHRGDGPVGHPGSVLRISVGPGLVCGGGIAAPEERDPKSKKHRATAAGPF